MANLLIKVYHRQQGVQPCSPGTFLMQASLTLSSEADYCHTCLTCICFAYLYHSICKQLMSFIMLAEGNGLSSLFVCWVFFCLFGISPFLPLFLFLASVVHVAPEGFLSLALEDWRTTKIGILTLCKKSELCVARPKVLLYFLSPKIEQKSWDRHRFSHEYWKRTIAYNW